jgi:farnesyl-diphosphate farnesyltransferase
VTAILTERAPDRAFCDAMLPKVSRTFALCIRLLPAELEYQVLVAYLLCRIADTIEDSTRLTTAEQDRLFVHYRRTLDEGGPDAGPLVEAFREGDSDHDRLAHHADRVLREFHRFPPDRRDAIRPWVQEMVDGMASFARRKRPGGGLEVLGTVQDLDRYCYFVAGTVGHLLTELFSLHARARAGDRYGRLRALASSFGLGLQLTNIVKDVADDRARGWSFVPRQLCRLAGVEPEELHDERHHEAGRRVMLLLIARARQHLLDALEYSTTVWRRQYGIRMFCLTSLYFAVRTLALAERDARLLDPTYKVKISRAQVFRTVIVTRVIAPSNTLVRAYFRRLAGDGWRQATVLP